MPIFDQGYQHWQGQLAGHGWRWLAVTRHGVRVGLKNRLLRLLLLGALVPALALAGVISVWGLVEQKAVWALALLRAMGFRNEMLQDPTSFRLTAWTLCFHFFLQIELFIIMVLVLLVGPSLISQDLRYNALPLYFSRPVRRLDYFLGKLGVIGFFLGMVAVVPAVAAWVLGLFFSLDFRAILETFRLLMGMVLFGAIVTLSAGLFMLALSSLSRNSRYIAVFWGGMWLLTYSVSGMLENIHQGSLRRNDWELQSRMGSMHYRLKNMQMLGPEKRREDIIVGLQTEMEKLQEEIKKRQEDAEAALRSDWRPIISYTANLQRLGFALIGSQEAWTKLDKLMEPVPNNRDPFAFTYNRPRLAPRWVPQYPWYWSALILLALGGLSSWILNKRVTSLDRLR